LGKKFRQVLIIYYYFGDENYPDNDLIRGDLKTTSGGHHLDTCYNNGYYPYCHGNFRQNFFAGLHYYDNVDRHFRFRGHYFDCNDRRYHYCGHYFCNVGYDLGDAANADFHYDYCHFGNHFDGHFGDHSHLILCGFASLAVFEKDLIGCCHHLNFDGKNSEMPPYAAMIS